MRLGRMNQLLWMMSSAQAATALAVAWFVASRGDDNHIGFEPRLLALVPIGGLLMASAAATVRASARAAACALALSLLLLAGIIAIDQSNMLLSYERWLDRGMPESPLR